MRTLFLHAHPSFHKIIQKFGLVLPPCFSTIILPPALWCRKTNPPSPLVYFFQDALDAATPGTTILIEAGTYNESLKSRVREIILFTRDLFVNGFTACFIFLILLLCFRLV